MLIVYLRKKVMISKYSFLCIRKLKLKNINKDIPKGQCLKKLNKQKYSKKIFAEILQHYFDMSQMGILLSPHF